MKVYQLFAVGALRYMEGRHTIPSKQIYTSRERAEKEIPTFIEKCADSGDFKSLSDLRDLQKESIKVQVIELELVD